MMPNTSTGGGTGKKPPNKPPKTSTKRAPGKSPPAKTATAKEPEVNGTAVATASRQTSIPGTELGSKELRDLCTEFSAARQNSHYWQQQAKGLEKRVDAGLRAENIDALVVPIVVGEKQRQCKCGVSTETKTTRKLFTELLAEE